MSLALKELTRCDKINIAAIGNVVPHLHVHIVARWKTDPLRCRICLEAGRVTPATVADHVKPHRGDFTSFRLGELRSLCADCHNRLDAKNSPRSPVREDGTPSDPNHSWNAC